MRWTTLRLLMLVSFFSFFSIGLSAQNCFNTGLNGTVINLPCDQNCVNVPVRIPHLKSTTDYVVNSINYTPYPYVTTGGVELTELYEDDVFSNLITLPFSFCFYDSIYNKVVIGSNGVITFDEICKAPADNAYTLTTPSGVSQPIPYNVGSAPSTIGTTYYPRASIMGAYHDIYPTLSAGGQRKIEYSIVGSAPCRKFVVSYFSVPMFGTACNSLLCTEQIVIYESTGVVEVYLGNKPLCSSWQNGRAILGIQNWNRDKAVAAPGKNCTAWSESNTGYSFVPSGGASRFKNCKVYDLSGNFIANGDTVTTTAGFLDVTFPTFCPAGTGGQYVIKTTFTSCSNAATELVSSDTITINKTANLNASGTTTQTTCGASSGTATITVPTGIGTAPYKFVLNPGNITQTSPTNTTTFNGLAAGSYTVTVTDAGTSSCSSTVPVAITSTGVLGVDFTPTATTCNGASNGQIKVENLMGTAPYTFVLNPGNIIRVGPGPYTFTGLAANTYFVSVYDVGGCKAENIPVTVDAGPSITITMESTPTSCPGASNGSITVTGCTGTAPFRYSINLGPYQSSPTFNNLAASTYFITVEDAIGCKANLLPQTVDQGVGTLTGTAAGSATSCNGASDGSVTVTPTSGSGPYEYSINNGGTWQTSNIFSGLAVGSYTTIIREGGVCTSGGITATVTAGPALTGTASSNPTACSGVNNGSITVTPTNGSGPYQYALDAGNYQASATFTGVSAGSHTVKIKTASGCTSASISVTVAAGSALTATVATGNTSCSGASDGTITVTPTNGSGPYQYALDGGAYQAGATFTGVTAGSHNVKVKDNFGCISANIPATVTAGPVLTGTATSTSTACIGVNNGSVTVTADAGFTGPYQYALDGGTFQASNTFSGVAAGSHNAVIKSAAGCVSANIPVTVATGSTLTATVSSANTSCSGATDGTITVTPTNGGAPYQYALDGGTFQAGATFTGVAAGAHNIKFKDNFGCISPDIPVTVTAGPVLTGTASSTSTACAGIDNGSVTVTVDAGFTGPYQYALDAGTFQASNTFTGVAAGSHTAVIRNAAGCVSANIPVSVATGSALIANTSSTNTSCSGATDGTITVTPTNGGAPYQYALDGGTFQAGATFTGVAAGAHNIKFKDNFGCISSDISVTVTAGPTLTGTATSTSTACAGIDNGSVTATPGAGFTGPFQYALDGGTFQASNTFAGIAAGSHNVVIRNAAGCVSANIPVTVATGSALTANVSSANTSCSGATDGTITVTPTNGGAPYQYALDGGTFQAGATFIGVAAGAHNIKFKDNFGCISSDVPVTITAGPVLTGTASSTSTACIGVNNGSITVTPGAGFTGPYQYALDGGTFQSSNSFTGVAAGTHNVIIKNASGCISGQIQVTVAAGTALTGTATPTAVTCNSATNGVITVTPTNGSAPYQYALNGGTYQSSNTFTGLAANSYGVVIKDAFGCVSASIPVTIDQPAALAIPAPSIQAVTCNGASNGVITVNPTGGTPPYSYSIGNMSLQSTNTFTVAAGTYTVHVVDTKNCTSQVDNVIVTQPAALTATIISTTNSTCAGGSDGSIEVGASGGTTPYQYSSDGGTTFQASNLLPAKAGNYTVVVKDANNCTFTVSPNVVVGLTDNLTLSVTNPPAICEGTSVQLTATSNGTGYSWSTGTGNSYLTGATTYNPMAAPPSTTTYTVTATLGVCEKSAGLIVTVLPAPVPDAGLNGDICFGQSYQLQGSGGTTYNWSPATYLDDNTLASPQVIKPLKTTTYTLSVTDANNCSSLVSDNVTVNVVQPIKVAVTPLDTVVYAGAQFQLSATSEGTSYVWSPSAGLSNPYIPNPVAIAPSYDGAEVRYQVTAFTAAGCQGQGYATVRVYKGPEIYMVNAFTPNRDGKNETFVPFPVGIKQLNYFRVFNRWGQLVFSTNALNRGWDGKMGGVDQPNGIYVWMVQGITETGALITKKGTVTLIR